MDVTLRNGYLLAMQLSVMEEQYDSLSEGVRTGGFLDIVWEGGLPIEGWGFGE
jgi:hypothetical protein